MDGPGVAQVPAIHHPERCLVVWCASLGNHDVGRDTVPDDKFVQDIRSIAQGLPYAQAYFVLLQFVRSHASVLAIQPSKPAEVRHDQRNNQQYNGKSIHIITLDFFYQILIVFYFQLYYNI